MESLYTGACHVYIFMSSCVGGSKAPPRIYRGNIRAARAISTSSGTRTVFGHYLSPKNAIMCWGDSVRGPVQLSAAFLPLSVLFRDSMTAVNYGWTLSASCGSRANLGRVVGR